MVQPSFLKKYISYFTELPVKQVNSVYGLVDVTLEKGRYKLSTENAIHSYQDLYSVFANGFKNLHIQNHSINNLLVLGYGLGSISYLLDKQYNLTPDTIGIEINDDVITLCYQYGYTSSNINLLHYDAHEFVFETESKFDLICIDVFQDDFIPTKFEEKEFLYQVQNILAENGTVLINRLYHKHWKIETDKYFNEVFKEVFPDGKLMVLNKNCLIINH